MDRPPLHGSVKTALRLLDNHLRYVDTGGHSSCDDDGTLACRSNNHRGLDLDESAVMSLGMIRALSGDAAQ